MQIKIEIDSAYKEPKVIILTEKMTEEVNEILRKLSEEKTDVLAGFCEDTLTILDKADIYRIYSEAGKVIAATENGDYTIRRRLYELEEKLARDNFVRISNSEIVNLKKVKSFDLSISGTICVRLINGTTAYVSRRYVSKIKDILGV